MKSVIQPQIVKYTNEHKKKKWWHRVVSVLAGIAVFCTTYALILPAITLELSLVCEKPEHHHTDDCYETRIVTLEPVLSCLLDEHTHGSECFAATDELICGLEESEGHVHSEACLNEDGELICDMEESEGHSHSDSCYRQELICEMQEHIHSDECYEAAEEIEKQELVCSLEEHEHTAACFDAPKAIDKTYVCGKEEHTHSEDCYFSDGTLKCTMQEHQHMLACKNDVRTITSEPTSEDVKVEAAFTMETPEAAYEHNDNKYPDTGDIDSNGATNAEKYITVYDLSEGHITSSGMDGLYSNDETFGDEVTGVTRKHMGQQSDAFPKPVMQLVGNGTFDPTGSPPAPGYADSDALPKLKKQIDYLGKNGIVGTEDLYRLYLSLELTPAPLDVLLVLDQSESMANDMMGHERFAELEEPMKIECTIPFESFEWDDDEGAYLYEDEDEGYVYYLCDEEDSWIDIYWPEFDVWSDYGEYDIDTGDVYIEMYYGFNPEFSGTSRQEVLMKFLNGKKSDHSDGFISMFREVNENNHLAILTFSGDCSLSPNRYIMPWDSTAVSIDDLPYPEGATNYSAALDIASLVLEEQADCTNRKIMIFLSDGVPTVAYSDGQMQHSYANGNVIGSGNNYVQYSLSDEVKQYIEAAYNETLDPELGSGIVTRSFLHDILSADGYFEDDFGNVYNHEKFFSTADVFQSGSTYGYYNYTDYGYPQMVDLSFVSIPVPGINGTWGPFTTENASEFLNWYNGSWNVWSDAQKDAWITANVTATGGEYDIFYLTENSFLDFRQACPDVAVYTIGFSANDFNTMPSGRSGDEVLKYMAGDMGSDPSGRYYNCANEGDISKVILDIASISGVSIIDPLTEYVDLSEAPKLEITMTLGEGAGAVTKTLYGYDSVQEKYDFTTDGRYYLDTKKTKFDTDGTLYVVFKPEHRFYERFYCETSFEVRVNAYAAEEYLQDGYNADGDEDTDYPGNNTSSLQPGFFSNDEAIAKWTFGVEDEGEFPNPVVQVHTVNIKLKKIDSGTSTGLAGAQFDLYREYSEAVTGSITYTDAKGVVRHLKKINTAGALTSERNNELDITGLYAGQYYLFETKAPEGYTCLSQPVVFDVAAKAITLSAGETNAQVNVTSPLLLEVKNFCSYRFPETGGIGTESFYVIGALLMFGALTIGYILWRRREGRGDV